MIKQLTLSVCLITSILLNALGQSETTFLSYPTLSPDGKTIVFSYDGDLWRVASEGGQAYRLTAMDGNEIAPRISPDSKWLAFSSNQNGNLDVYVMPLSGGDIKQLTYHDATDMVDSWSWDSKSIYFTSSRANRFTSFKIGVEGGSAKRVFEHFFNTIHNVVEKTNGELLFNDSWESYTAANRKRYKGEFNPDILSYNPVTKEYSELTDYEGKDFWASVDQHNNVYFASDEGNNEYNLYTFVKGKKTALTQFKTSIKRPFVAADGSKVVFEKDYKLHVYDVASKKSYSPEIYLGRNQTLNKDDEYNVEDNISRMDISPDGKKIAFVSRGELFVSDITGKFVRQMPSSGERVMEVKWLKDNKTLLYNQTYQGYLNWFTRTADGLGEEKQWTKDLRNNRDIEFNKERTTAVYVSGRDQIRIMDLESYNSTTVVNDEIWAFQNSTPSFSPDGKYLLYTARRNFEEDIFVYHLETKQNFNLTNTGVSETGPVWSPDGQYIYFASNRTKPSYPTGMQNSSIYRIALDYFDQPYRSEKFEELFEKKEDKEETEKNQKLEAISLNIEGLMDRVQRVSPSFGTQNGPVVFQKGQKTFVLYYSNQNEGKPAMYRTVIEPFENNKTEKMLDGRVNNIVEISGKFYAISRGTIHQLNVESGKLDKVNISYKFRRNLKNEFKQMFEETWAGIEENFYEEGFHGLDWTKVKKEYAQYIPHLNNRADLRVLLNDMLGELNSSHLGFNSNGPEERVKYRVATNEIGVVFEIESPYTVARILEKGPAGRKGVDIQKGDVIVAVNGQRIDSTKDRDYYFTFPTLLDEIQLTILRHGQEVHTRLRPQSNSSLQALLYDEWIENNRAKVNELSGNKIAYTHMKNMGGEELEQFLLDMTRFEHNTQGTILDLRYNTGGNVHDEVLKFLSQKPYLQWQYRGGKRSPQGHFAPAGKPIVLLINQQSLSDAEMTAAGFKALELGKVIGTETYRWIIFTSGKGLVDGSMYRVPAWGCYTLDGQNLELTGVKPDIYVKNKFEDKIEGKDPQLERAVEEILKDLK